MLRKIAVKALTAFTLYCGSVFAAAAAPEKTYTIPILANNYLGYEKFLASRDPATITDLTSPLMSRETMELLVFQIAASIGGCNCKIIYTPSESLNTAVRSIALVARGSYMAYPSATWRGDPNLTDDVALREPILDASDMFVGLYAHIDRADVLSITDLDAIRKLRFVIGERWKIDQSVLDAQGLDYTTADKWENALLMLKAGRGDVMMQPFTPKEDFSFTEASLGETYRPIPGVKMRFPFSRNYYVSKTHPDGPDFLAALNRGLRTLRDRGFLRHGHIASGVIDPRVADWRIFE